MEKTRTKFKFWFRPDIAEAIIDRYRGKITLNRMVFNHSELNIREMVESTAFNDLYFSVSHLGAEPNPPDGANFKIQVIEVESNVSPELTIKFFENLGGFFCG